MATTTASWPGLSRPSTTSRHFSNDGWMPATSSGYEKAGPRPKIYIKEPTPCASAVEDRRCSRRGQMRGGVCRVYCPVANTSNLDKDVKRRRILPPGHGQKLHLVPDGVALYRNSGE